MASHTLSRFFGQEVLCIEPEQRSVEDAQLTRLERLDEFVRVMFAFGFIQFKIQNFYSNGDNHMLPNLTLLLMSSILHPLINAYCARRDPDTTRTVRPFVHNQIQSTRESCSKSPTFFPTLLLFALAYVVQQRCSRHERRLTSLRIRLLL